MSTKKKKTTKMCQWKVDMEVLSKTILQVLDNVFKEIKNRNCHGRTIFELTEVLLYFKISVDGNITILVQ